MTDVDQPKLAAPDDACDCHMHAFDARFPLPAGIASPPADATADAYLNVRRRLGLTRAVVVQPNGYGFDNRCTLDAMSTLGAETRGIAVVPLDVADTELVRLAAAGVRGVRYHLFPGGALGIDTMAAMASRIVSLGWNINLQLDGCELHHHEALLSTLPCELVVDHVGKFGRPISVDDPAFDSLRRLLDRGHCWVKLSAPYESSRAGPPDYADVTVLVKALVASHPERCLWASNWPHNNQAVVPSTTALFDLLLDWIPDATTRKQILAINPAIVYGFASSKDDRSVRSGTG